MNRLDFDIKSSEITVTARPTLWHRHIFH